MKIYSVNIILADPEEPLENSNKVFLDKKEAEQYYKDSIKNWKKNRRVYLKDVLDMTDEEIEKLENESLMNDIRNEEYCLTNYIYNDGVEMLLELTTEEVSNVGLFVVTEEFKYMNSECEIGNEIHLITTDFKKAFKKAIDLKAGLEEEFENPEHNEEIINSTEYYFQIRDEYDEVTIKILNKTMQ